MTDEELKKELLPIFQKYKETGIKDEDTLMPLLRKFLDSSYAEGKTTDEAFDQYDNVMANVVDELGLQGTNVHPTTM